MHTTGCTELCITSRFDSRSRPYHLLEYWCLVFVLLSHPAAHSTLPVWRTPLVHLARCTNSSLLLLLRSYQLQLIPRRLVISRSLPCGSFLLPLLSPHLPTAASNVLVGSHYASLASTPDLPLATTPCFARAPTLPPFSSAHLAVPVPDVRAVFFESCTPHPPVFFCL